MPDFLPNYSLQTYPYDVEPLNPLAVSTHAQLLIRVAGLSEVDQIDNSLQQAARQPGPVFALVTGQESCGLTSVANYLLAQYVFYRGIDTRQFVVPDQRKVTNDNAYEFWVNWIASLVDQLDRQRLVKSGQVEQLEAGLDKVVPGKFFPFMRLFRGLAEELNALQPPAGFGVCIENPKNKDFIETAFQMFTSTRTLCVFVIGDYADGRDKAIRHFNDYDSGNRKLTVEMGPIRGEDVELLVRERWQRSAAGVPVPFEQRAVALAFDDRPRPIKRIMILLERLLEHKALVEYPRKVWPRDRELEFTSADLGLRMKIYDKPLKS